ncbi:MAG TPA: chemotaxis response regulator protein-glutamate methylesterase [Candidatus Saccharimonadales bacterium]|nr:chemotaxis response regulator protein-glutamate methylesterase [Candidatus Saccharimonadales bacterium]
MMSETTPGRKDHLHVLVVDDSAMVRQVMQAILNTDRRIRVTVAADPLIALTKFQKDRADVIITDLEMPRMDGLSFVRKIMAESPVPMVVCSGLAAKGAEMALCALQAGAVEVIHKPKLGVREFLHESTVSILDAVWSASQVRLRRSPETWPAPRLTADAILPLAPSPAMTGQDRDLVVVGASTGGTEALHVFLTSMPPDCPPIVVVQHMPEVFTRAFAERLNQDCAIHVKEAADNDRLRCGEALIAPGNLHTLVRSSRGAYVIKVTGGPLVSRHRPSVDVLFRSVALAAGARAIGVIMTGMGDDGVQGLLEMKAAGAATIAQNEATCAVFGMPREAVRRGAIDFVLPLREIAGRALELLCVQQGPGQPPASRPDRSSRSLG